MSVTESVSKDNIAKEFAALVLQGGQFSEEKLALVENMYEYYDRNLNNLGAIVWLEAVQDIAYEQLYSVIKQWLAKSPFLPTPLQILEEIHGGIEIQALKEWNRIRTLVVSPDITQYSDLISGAEYPDLILEIVHQIFPEGLLQEKWKQAGTKELEKTQNLFIKYYSQCVIQHLTKSVSNTKMIEGSSTFILTRGQP